MKITDISFATAGVKFTRAEVNLLHSALSEFMSTHFNDSDSKVLRHSACLLGSLDAVISNIDNFDANMNKIFEL